MVLLWVWLATVFASFACVIYLLIDEGHLRLRHLRLRRRPARHVPRRAKRTAGAQAAVLSDRRAA